MPKHKTKDRMFITATEWATEYGGHKKRVEKRVEGALPFECCALSLLPFETPACTRKEGVLFDWVGLVEFVRAHGTSPATGAVLTTREIVRLRMAKNGEGRWMCPVTHKVFTNYSKVAAVGTTGNTYAYEALKELCLKPNKLFDLLDGTPFARSDVIVVQDPDDPELSRRRDVSNLHHLKNHEQEAPSIRPLGEGAEKVLAAARENVERAQADRDAKRRKTAEDLADPARPENEGLTETFLRVRKLGARTDEVLEGSKLTSGKTSASLTSSAVGVATSNELREATDDELKAARWKILRSLGKKGYVRLETSLGLLNIEVHCDMCPRAAENFLGLCSAGYYDDLQFHRVVPGFVAQAGDPRNDGTGGESLWGAPFADEFDSRLRHDARGILAYASDGRDRNRSQFYVTFDECPNLDNKHTVFGRVVGGMDTLNRIERADVDEKDDHRPRRGREVVIRAALVFVDPTSEADDRFEKKIAHNVRVRRNKNLAPPVAKKRAPPGRPTTTTTSSSSSMPHTAATVGKYLQRRP
ncbi:hypothetical protein CTAYLR_001201 [Chrysophaeum taylorii]|uniref:RING-type E3 ubiquitin transferase n=1 Tax=Chrysophaeum taylorii TaxID=2483200 RepID=A0AAD7UEK5_9STRA|nr:hypothetical protein CTAYLR_001201 [Chrysophaeum taylorii]